VHAGVHTSTAGTTENVNVVPGATPRFAVPPIVSTIVPDDVAAVTTSAGELPLATQNVVDGAGVASTHEEHVNWIGWPTSSVCAVSVES
jgi:hypothetical protein